LGYLRIGIHTLTFFVCFLALSGCGENSSDQGTVDADVATDVALMDDVSMNSDAGQDVQIVSDAGDLDMEILRDSGTGDLDTSMASDQMVDGGFENQDAMLGIDQSIVDATQLPPSLWSVMSDRGDMAAFLSLLEIAGYRTALEGVGRYTVFAPTDDVMQSFIEVNNLDASQAADVARIVDYHLVDDVMSQEAIRNRATIETRLGESVRVSLSDERTILNENIQIDVTSLEATNGFIHPLDGVLDPDVRPVGDSVMSVLRSEGQFTRFVQLLEDFGLDDILSEPGPFTVFAPTNTAIENWERIRGNLNGLRSEQRRFLIERHLLDEFTALTPGESPLSFAGITLPITLAGDALLVAGARITEGPYSAQNGGVFVLSDVIAREQDPTLYDWLRDDGRFDVFVSGLDGCGLNFLLDQDDWTSLITVLAPTDSAFVQYDILTDNARFDIFSDPLLLGEFMRHHLLANERFFDDLTPLAAVESASGRLLPITVSQDSDLYVAGSKVSEADVILHNGLLHVMESVISPPEIVRSGDCSEPLPLGLDQVEAGSNLYGDGVYQVNGLAAGTYCVSTYGSGFDTLLKVRDECLSAGDPSKVNDDIVPGVIRTSNVEFTATQGETPFILIEGANGEDGDFIVHLTQGACESPVTIYELLELMPNYVTFLIGLDITGDGLGRLDADGATTVFVPDENAFDDLDRPDRGGSPGTLDRLLNDTNALELLIRHHMLDGAHRQDLLAELPTWTSLAGQTLLIDLRFDELFVNGSLITQRDFQARNGVLHTVDQVIKPQQPCISSEDCDVSEVCLESFCVPRPEAGNLLEELTRTGRHTRFIQFLQSANMTLELAHADGDGLTVFAPVDEAFDLLEDERPDFVESLVNDGVALRHFLSYHLLNGAYESSELYASDRLLTVNGLMIDIDAGVNGIFLGNDSDETPVLNDVGEVIWADLPATNGVIHRINRLLFAPTVPPASSCEAPTEVLGFGSFIGETIGGGSDLIGTCSDQFCAADDTSTPESVFQFTAPVSGRVCASTRGSSYDTVLYVRSTCSDNQDSECATTSTNGDEDGFCEVCNDDSAFAEAPQSALEFAVEANKHYYIVVDGCTPSFQGALPVEGYFRLSITEGGCRRPNTVFNVINREERRFRTLLHWLRISGLDNLLDREDDYTIFAPTETAFDLMEAQFPGFQAELVQDPERLRTFLLHHVVEGVQSTDLLVENERAFSIAGPFLEFEKRGSFNFVNAKSIVTANVEADNGYVHILDDVLMLPLDCSLGGGPQCANSISCLTQVDGCQCIDAQCMPLPPRNTLFGELESRRYPPEGTCLTDLDCGDGGLCQGGQCSLPMFSDFLGFVEQVGLRTSFEDNGPFTLFAPTNYAFDLLREFDNASFQNITSDLLLLEELVRFHRVLSDLDSDLLMSLPEVFTDLGKTLSVSSDEDGISVGGALIQATDQRAYNGVFHVIDEVLLPPIEVDGCVLPTDITFGSVTESLDEGGSVYWTTCGAGARNRERVYRFLSADEDRRICVTTHGSDFDTVLHIRKGQCESITGQTSCDDGVNFTCCNDDAAGVGSLTTSQLTLNADAGVPYYIFVDSFSAQASGNAVVSILEGGCDNVPVLDDVVDVLGAYEETFSLMKGALQRVQMNRELEDSDSTFTLFAPTDIAFRRWMSELPDAPEALNEINVEILEAQLRYITSVGYYSSLELLAGAELASLSGTPVFVDQRGTTIFANGNAVSVADRRSQNGVVHEMDVMLMPPDSCDQATPCGSGFECSESGFCRSLPPPGTCANPLPMGIGSSGADTSGMGDLVGLNFDEGSCGGRVGNEAVFEYLEEFGTRELCLNTSGSNFNTILYVRESECYDAANELDCNDDTILASPLASALSFTATFGRRYYVFVDGYATQESGSIILQLSEGPCE
jgi:transforming growth factor-beta-induced protein